MSYAGKGTRFDIRLPLDMAVVDGNGGTRWGCAIRCAGECHSKSRQAIPGPMWCTARRMGMVNLLKFDGGLVRVQDLLDKEAKIMALRSSSIAEKLYVVVDGERGRLALTIDEFDSGGSRYWFVALQGQLADVQDASGCALLGEVKWYGT